MKKLILMLLVTLSLLTLTGCEKETEESLAFKKSYESLNTKTNSLGNEYRAIKIESNNPFVQNTAENIVDMIKNEETFYVYFGDEMCPWCRSVLEEAVASAKQNKIDKIYYVDIWDENHNEILRDKYTLNKKNKPEKETDGTDAYYELLEYFKDLLKEYTLKDEKGNTVEVGEKRIFAPTFIYVENGLAKKLVSGISEKQTTSSGELTTEIREDELRIFNEFFTKDTD